MSIFHNTLVQIVLWIWAFCALVLICVGTPHLGFWRSAFGAVMLPYTLVRDFFWNRKLDRMERHHHSR